MSNTAKKFFVAALCGALVAAAWATGLLDLLGAPERVRDLLREGGHASWAVFLLAFTILSAVGVPSVVFLVPMPLVWPMPVSLALGIVGSMTSSVLGFWIARYVARDWVANHLPARLQRFDERLANNGLRTVVIIRMIFFLTPPSTWFLALSRIPLSTYVVGTLVGGLPGIIFFVVVGGSFFGWLAGRPPWVWAVSGAATLAWTAWRRRSAESNEGENHSTS